MTLTARLARRWPTWLALTAAVVCAVVILGLDADVEFAPGVAIMMGAYPAAYAIGNPATVWPAFGALVLVVLGFASLGINVGYGMTAVQVVLGLAVLGRGQARDGRLQPRSLGRLSLDSQPRGEPPVVGAVRRPGHPDRSAPDPGQPVALTDESGVGGRSVHTDNQGGAHVGVSALHVDVAGWLHRRAQRRPGERSRRRRGPAAPVVFSGRRKRRFCRNRGAASRGESAGLRRGDVHQSGRRRTWDLRTPRAAGEATITMGCPSTSSAAISPPPGQPSGHWCTT